MRFTTFKGEGDLTALASRVYSISGPLAAERLEKAREALLAANPQLRKFSDLRRGTVLLIPDLPGFIAVPEDSSSASSSTAPVSREPVIGAEVLDDLRRALREMQKTLDASITFEAQEYESALALAKDRELRIAADRFSEVGRQLGEISEQAKKNLDAANEARRTLKATFDRYEQELEAFRQRLS